MGTQGQSVGQFYRGYVHFRISDQHRVPQRQRVKACFDHRIFVKITEIKKKKMWALSSSILRFLHRWRVWLYQGCQNKSIHFHAVGQWSMEGAEPMEVMQTKIRTCLWCKVKERAMNKHYSRLMRFPDRWRFISAFGRSSLHSCDNE